MKINIDGKTQYDVLWMEGPTLTDGTVWIKLESKGPLHELVQAFETAEQIESETENAKKFVGLKLVQIRREKGGTVYLQFEQGE